MSDESPTQEFRKAEVQLKDYKEHVSATIVLLLVIGYIFLVFTLVGLWSDKAGEAVIGFALFAQSTISKYFEDKKQQRQAESAVK